MSVQCASKRFIAAALTPEEKAKIRRRANEWKKFRADNLYSQKLLAEALNCSVRTVASIESACEVVRPNINLLRRFKLLQREEKRENRTYDERVA